MLRPGTFAKAACRSVLSAHRMRQAGMGVKTGIVPVKMRF